MRVLLVDDHALFRGALKLALQEAFESAELAESETGEEALASLEAAPADLVLVDLGLPDMNGRELLRRLKAREPSPRCVVVSASESLDDIRGAVRAGADGYILKRSSIKVLRNALELVLSGERYVPLPDPSTALGEPDGGGSETTEAALRSLTARQRDVLRLVACGQSNKRIAQRLGMLEGTVKVHLRDIFRKLRVANRTQAAMLASQLDDEPKDLDRLH